MNYVDVVIKVAKKEVGYLEKATPKYEDNKTKNAGYNNFTKYGRDLAENIGSPYCDGVFWCDEFVDWCFIKAYGEKQAKKLLGGWSAYCPTSAQYFRDMGRWYTSPKKGDVIFFLDSDNEEGHTGIVTNVDSYYVYTIEGNTSPDSGVIPNGGGVHEKKYLLNYSRIAGYGRPKYDTKKTTPKKYSGGFPIIPPALRYGSAGLQVDRLQRFLNWYGNYGLIVDEIFGMKTKSAVLDFQEKVFYDEPSEWDGIFGSKSLAKAKKVKK